MAPKAKPRPKARRRPTYVRLLRGSELSSFNRCPQQWAWTYRDGRKIPPRDEHPALRFGTLIHRALELRYPPGTKRGPHPAETFAALYQEQTAEAESFGWRDEEGTWTEAGDLGVAMMEEFVRQYGDDSRYAVLASEIQFQQRISPDLPGVYFVGTMDGLWQDRETKHILIHDWKTAASIRTDHLPLDPQASGYWTFGVEWMRENGLLKPKQQLQGMLYTYLRKAFPDDRPRNADGHYLNNDGSVSKKQPPPLFQRVLDVKTEAQRASFRRRVLDQYDRVHAIETGKAPLYKTPGSMVCSNCGLRNLCILHESDAPGWEDYARRTMVDWDPYEQHEIRDEGRN